MKAKTLPPARRLALAAVTDCLDRGRDLQAALDDALRSGAPEPAGAGRAEAPRVSAQDVALATQLAYGYLRRKGQLDYVFSVFLTAPDRLPSPVRLILGLAGFEILFLDRIPAYASVDWAVERVKAVSFPHAKMANAVLRRLDRERNAVAEDDFYRRGAARPLFLSRRYSCPEWIVSLWLQALGEADARRLLAGSLAEPPTGLRVNLAKPGAAELHARLAAHPDGLPVQSPTLAFRPGADLSAFDLPGLVQAGLVSRQGAASQEALLALLPPDAAGPVWDACAGRGGKTMLLLERGLAPVLASDPNLGRLRGLPRELDRLGLDRCLAFRARADRQPPLRRPAPLVLVDAPCSGLGVLSRRPDAKWKRTPQDVAAIAALQGRILEQAPRAVAPGGTLIYLTCTVNPAENQDHIKPFLAAHGEFDVARVWSTPLESPWGEFFWGAALRRRK